MTVGTPGGWLATASLAAAAATMALAGYLARHRGKPGANWFLLQLTAQAIFCTSYGVSLFAFDPVVRTAFEVVTWLAFSWIGPLFLAFALEYTGRSTVVRSWLFAPVYLIPAAVSVLLVTVPYHDLAWANFAVVEMSSVAIAQYDLAPALILDFLVGVVGTAVGFLLLLETVLSYGPLYRREATAVALSPILPAAALVAWAFELGPYPHVNLAPLAFLPHVAFDAYAFGGTTMFESNPTTLRAAERSAIDDLSSPVVVLDAGDRVVKLNDAARYHFDADDDTLGQTLPAVTGLPTEDLADGNVVALSPSGQRREFLVSTSALTDRGATRVGTTVVFQDITTERHHQQRLEVLNRVLRHNLRNEMTVIQGYAQTIERRAGDNEMLAKMAREIQDAGSDLTSIGEKAHEFERLMDRDRAPAPIALHERVADIVAPLADDYPDATINTDAELPDSTTLHTDPAMLDTVLHNLIENALQHADSDTPQVTVRATTPDDNSVAIHVADDGPGIPDAELTPLETGTEDALEHGSGIGLWVTQWTIRQLGGGLNFDTGPDGTAVTVRLPRTPPNDSPDPVASD
jgi:signal transduction histidine kinase